MNERTVERIVKSRSAIFMVLLAGRSVRRCAIILVLCAFLGCAATDDASREPVHVPDPTLSQKLKADVKVLTSIEEAVQGMEHAVQALRERHTLGTPEASEARRQRESDTTTITNGEEKLPDTHMRWVRSKAIMLYRVLSTIR